MLKNISVNKHFLMGLDGVESLTGSHKYDRPSQVWQALTGMTGPHRYDRPHRHDRPSQVWQALTGMTGPHRYDRPSYVWQALTGMTGPHRYDRPSQVWQALKGIQQLRVKHAFHLLSTKRYWPYPRAQSKWSDGIQVVSSIHTDQDWYTIYISCVTH